MQNFSANKNRSQGVITIQRWEFLFFFSKKNHNELSMGFVFNEFIRMQQLSFPFPEIAMLKTLACKKSNRTLNNNIIRRYSILRALFWTSKFSKSLFFRVKIAETILWSRPAQINVRVTEQTHKDDNQP